MQQYFELLTRFLGEFSRWNPPQLTMYTIFGFGILSAWIMTRIVAAPPLFAGPICFLILTISAMFSNFAAKGVGMMGTSELQKALIFTVLGHAISGVVLLAVFKVGEKGIKK